MFATRAGRAWRGLVAALAATFFATVSHSLADGTAASPLAVILALTVAVPVCVALAGRRLSWVRLSAAVGLSQFVFHALLLMGVGVGSAPLTAAVPSGPVHLHSAVMAAVAAAPPDASGLAHAGHAGTGMWLAHVAAAIVTIFAIGHGERALCLLLDLLHWRFLERVVTWHPSPSSIRLPAPAGGTLPTVLSIFLSDARRRGPPVAA